MNKTKLYNKLKILRLHKNLSRKELADLLDVSVDTIKSWQCGRTVISDRNLDRLKECFLLEGLEW